MLINFCLCCGEIHKVCRCKKSIQVNKHTYTDDELIRLAGALDTLQITYNKGRGISHIQTVIYYLEQCDLEKALAVISNEGDKTTAYPLVLELINKYFGCRSHHKINCYSIICNPL